MESAELLRLIRNAVGNKPETVPPGWRTARDLAEQWGIQIGQTLKHLREGMAAGVIEFRKFRVENGQRGVYPVPHYRAKQ